jgi:trehalose 6-phosphate phosphatase
MPPTTGIDPDEGWALFLDVDGTLLEIAPTPQQVVVPDHLRGLLNDVYVRLDGALALVSGRSLESLDQLFAPLRFSASGIHGCERRTPDGCVIQPDVDQRKLDAVRNVLIAFVEANEGLLIEDKRYGLAVHFRRVPHLGAEVRERMQAMLSQLGPEFALQAGKCVFELRPSAWTKGASIATFMREPPFRDRRPIYIGDDLTDEDAFAVVNAFGGVSIRVGEATSTLAQHRLASVPDVLRWLETNPPARARA